MKKCLAVILFLCLICLFATGCTGKDISETESNSPKSQESSTAATGEVDVDLTVMSSTVVYAKVYDMMVNPDDYLGQLVKASGPYFVSFFEETDQYYHFVIIEDAAACCQQGLEFIWNGDHIYPDEYPEEKTIIEVTGVFDSYEELGHTYYYLAVDDISVLK